MNEYGPTETVVGCSIYTVPPGRAISGAVPIGLPIANTQFYVLDARLQPVPIGVVGELYIGGDGVARGYLGRPDLTAERFIPDPFSGEPGCRLYKTGDLVRLLADRMANIEFLGRRDHQVKIRGYRVELGEVEAVLAEHPGVRETAVIAHADEGASKRLIAYVVGHAGQPEPTVAELRGFVQRQLPDYMVPTAFVFLSGLPLTTTGKLDRQALPTADGQRPETAVYVAPRSEAEVALAQIWSEVLRVDRVGIHDNFFELGGDSILSIQIVSRAHRAGFRLSPRDLFEHQTIAALGAIAGAARSGEAQGPVTGAVALIPIQHWFFEQELSDRHHWNQSLLLQAKEGLDPTRLAQAIGHLLRHHDALRLRFRRDGAVWHQEIVTTEEAPEVAQIDLSGLEGDQAAALREAASALQRGLDLERGPLVRVALFALQEGRWDRLLMVIHHLAVDTVSWRVLLEDLQSAYEPLDGGGAVRLPEKTTSFQRWAERLVAYGKSAEARQELNYWLGAVKGCSRLPVDRLGINSEVSAQTVSVGLDAAETQALLQAVPAAYRTQINDVLLTALVEACAPWIGSRRLLLALEGHGREDLFDDIDLSRTVGWFTSLFPVTLNLEGIAGPGEALKAVKEQLRQVPKRGIGYGVLRYLSGDVEMGALLRGLPQAELSFNYLGQFDQQLSSSSLFQLAEETSGPTRSGRQKRPHMLDVNGLIVSSCLRLDWTYSSDLHERETIEALAQHYLAALRGLIAHCQSVEPGAFTPSDFPLARLDQAGLDRLTKASAALEDIYPLSHMQQGLLFHALYQPHLDAYFEQLYWVQQGGFEEALFSRAWQRVLDRHAALRASFVWEGVKDPVQVIHAALKFPCEQIDWRGVGVAEQQEHLAAFLAADRERGFLLEKAPLLRLAVIRLGDERHQLVLSFHHLLLDGWSLAAVLQEVFADYRALCEGREVAVPARRPYRDYIAWLQRQDLAAAAAYWRATLAGFSSPTPLGVDQPLAEPERLGAMVHGERQHELSVDRSAALQGFAVGIN